MCRQFPASRKNINGISAKSTGAFYYDNVDQSLGGIGEHSLETIPVIVGSAFIIDLNINETPINMVINILGQTRDLITQTSQLCLLCAADAAIERNPLQRQFTVLRIGWWDEMNIFHAGYFLSSGRNLPDFH